MIIGSDGMRPSRQETMAIRSVVQWPEQAQKYTGEYLQEQSAFLLQHKNHRKINQSWEQDAFQEKLCVCSLWQDEKEWPPSANTQEECMNGKQDDCQEKYQAG